MITEAVRALIRLLREKVHENVVLSAGSIVEIAKLPVIVLNGPTLTEKKRLMRDPERITVIDEEAGQAVREVPPRWYDLNFDVNVTCESNLELLELITKFSQLSQSNPLLMTSKGKYLWAMSRPLGSAVSPNISQVYQGSGELIIYDVAIYSDIREVWPLIANINIERKVEVQL